MPAGWCWHSTPTLPGQGAAEKFYEWEQKYQVEVAVARFPDGKDPADLAMSDPEALRHAVDQALPFLGFRLDRLFGSRARRDEPRTAVSPRERGDGHRERAP